MKRQVLALVAKAMAAAVLLAGAALIGSAPVGAQVPGIPCTAADVDTHGQGGDASPRGGLSAEKMVWDPDAATNPDSANPNRGSWVVQSFGCTDTNPDPNIVTPGWVKYGHPRHNFQTQDKPSGYHYTGDFTGTGASARAVVVAGDSTTPASPPAGTTYWDTGRSREITRLASQYIQADKICAALKQRTWQPSHIYRVGNHWHHIPNQADRDAWEAAGPDFPSHRSGTTMSSIWSSSASCS